MTDSTTGDGVAPWEDDATNETTPSDFPEYPEYDDSSDANVEDDAADNAVFSSNAVENGADETVPPEKEPLIDEIASEFVGFWNLLVSQTNWEKGKVIHSWRTKLIEAGLPRRIYSDDSLAQKIGNVSAQHVGRLRRVFERFGAAPPLPKLYWSHYQAALDWEDADDWLKKASDEGLSVAQTRIARWEKYGAPQSRKPKESEIVVAEPDEDVNPFNDSDADFTAFGGNGGDVDGEKTAFSGASGGRREYEDGAITPEKTELNDDGAEGKTRKAKKGAKDSDDDLDEFNGENEPWEAESTKPSTADVLDDIAKLDPLPTDLSDAFESLKVGILSHKLSNWADVKPIQIAAYLSAMKRLLVSEEK